MEKYFSIYQLLGLVGLIFSFLASFSKVDLHLRRYSAIGSFFYFLQMFSINNFASSITCLIISIRQATSHLIKQRHKKLFIFLYALFFIASFVYFFKSFWDFFPLFAALNATFAFIYLKDIKLRLTLVLSDLFWLIFSINFFSLGLIIGSILNIVLKLFAAYRIKRLNS